MLRRAEDTLFERWKKILDLPEEKFFIPDGVVDEEEWLDTPFNVLFMLKEVNGGDCSWDERDYLRGYFEDERYIRTHSPSIDTLILWLHGIFHCASQTPWQQVLTERSQAHDQWLLRQMALINVKKTPGGAVADMKSVDAFAASGINQMFLNKQLSLYRRQENVDLIICGGTAHYLKQLDEEYAQKHWRTTARGVEYLRLGQTICLNFVHPLARVPKNYLFYTLLETLEEIDRTEHLGWSSRRPLKPLDL